MSDQEENSEFTHLIQLLDVLNKQGNGANANERKEDKSQYKAVILAAGLSVIIPFCVALFQMGELKQQLISAIEKNKLEMQAEYTKSFATQQEKYSERIRSLEDQIRVITEENRNLKSQFNEMEKDSKKIIDDVELNKRSINEQYRITTWLRSQHNANIPP